MHYEINQKNKDSIACNLIEVLLIDFSQYLTTQQYRKYILRKIGLKMLGLYLDTLIISHIFRMMLCKLNELTLQKELQNFM